MWMTLALEGCHDKYESALQQCIAAARTSQGNHVGLLLAGGRVLHHTIHPLQQTYSKLSPKRGLAEPCQQELESLLCTPLHHTTGLSTWFGCIQCDRWVMHSSTTNNAAAQSVQGCFSSPWWTCLSLSPLPPPTQTGIQSCTGEGHPWWHHNPGTNQEPDAATTPHSSSSTVYSSTGLVCIDVATMMSRLHKHRGITCQHVALPAHLAISQELLEALGGKGRSSQHRQRECCKH